MPSYEEQIEPFRDYLRVVARAGLDRQLWRRVDPSDVVQETLVKAYEARADLEGRSAGEIAEWLRRTLVRGIANAARDHRRAKRDLRRERDLGAALADSAVRLDALLEHTQASPSENLERMEHLQKLASALEALPEDYREVLLLRHWQGYKVADIAKKLGRTTNAIAIILHRAMAKLVDAIVE